MPLRPLAAAAPAVSGAWRCAAQMAELPLEPMMAKLVLSAPKMDCLDEAMHAHTHTRMHARRSFVRHCALFLSTAVPPGG